MAELNIWSINGSGELLLLYPDASILLALGGIDPRARQERETCKEARVDCVFWHQLMNRLHASQSLH